MLEQDLALEYDSWKADPTPATRGALIRKLEPTISRGVAIYAGKERSESLSGSAKQLALRALDTYDPERSGLKTHVTNHLRGLQRVAGKQQSVLSVPERISLDRNSLRRYEEELEDRLGRAPSTAELADFSGLSSKRIGRVRSYKAPVTEGTLDSAVSEGSGSGQPAVRYSNEEILLEAIYGEADPVDQKILEWTLGLHGQKQMSNNEIAQRLRLSPGAVSQRKSRLQQSYDQLAAGGLF